MYWLCLFLPLGVSFSSHRKHNTRHAVAELIPRRWLTECKLYHAVLLFGCGSVKGKEVTEPWFHYYSESCSGDTRQHGCTLGALWRQMVMLWIRWKAEKSEWVWSLWRCMCLVWMGGKVWRQQRETPLLIKDALLKKKEKAKQNKNKKQTKNTTPFRLE